MSHFSYLFRDPNFVLITKQNKLNLRGLWEKLYCALYQYQSVNCLTKYFPQDLLPSVNLNSLTGSKQNKTNILWMDYTEWNLLVSWGERHLCSEIIFDFFAGDFLKSLFSQNFTSCCYNITEQFPESDDTMFVPRSGIIS